VKRRRLVPLIVLGVAVVALFIYLGLALRAANTNTALLDAIRKDDTARATRCLASGANPDARGPWEAEPPSSGRSLFIILRNLFRHHPPDRSEPTALMIAARHGNPAVVEALVRRGADVNAEMSEGRTALMWAAGYGDAAMVKTLLDAGAHRDARDAHGDTALTLAQNNGETEADPEVVRLLSPAGRGRPAGQKTPGSGKVAGGSAGKAAPSTAVPPAGDDVD
jgi:ankyrin repeat protein